jgi:chromosome segregation ATPase
VPKNLLDAIDGIESSENQSAVLQAKIDRLQEMIEKHKRVTEDLEDIIDNQKIKIDRLYNVPEDVLELKELVGTQRETLKQRETDLERAKGEILAIQKEMDFTKRQMVPTQRKLDEGIETIDSLKTEIAEKNSELERVTHNLVEIQAFADKLQDEQIGLISDVDQKWKKELEQLRLDHLEEKKEMASQIVDLDTFLLDSKLTSTEATSEAKDLKSRFAEIRTQQENMINKLEDALDKKRIAEEDLRKKNSELEELSKFKKNNVKKISYYDKLTELMEREAQFKAFLIVEQVGSMTIEDLRNALVSPIVLVKKFVQNLQDVDLFEINDEGKITVKKLEET